MNFTYFKPDPRDPDTARFARTLREACRNPYDFWEASERDTGLVVDGPDRAPVKVSYRAGAPMRNAPSGAEAELQRVLLAKPMPLFPVVAFLRDTVVDLFRRRARS